MSERFYIEPVPLGISVGFAYQLCDKEKELYELEPDDIIFKYEGEAEVICDFLNKQTKELAPFKELSEKHAVPLKDLPQFLLGKD